MKGYKKKKKKRKEKKARKENQKEKPKKKTPPKKLNMRVRSQYRNSFSYWRHELSVVSKKYLV